MIKDEDVNEIADNSTEEPVKENKYCTQQIMVRTGRMCSFSFLWFLDITSLDLFDFSKQMAARAPLQN